MPEDLKEIYLKALEKWGPSKQIIQALEEMAELQKELCKFVNGREVNHENIYSEIADVKIMIEQMELFFGEVPVNHYRQAKLERLKERLGL